MAKNKRLSPLFGKPQNAEKPEKGGKGKRGRPRKEPKTTEKSENAASANEDNTFVPEEENGENNETTSSETSQEVKMNFRFDKSEESDGDIINTEKPNNINDPVLAGNVLERESQKPKMPDGFEFHEVSAEAEQENVLSQVIRNKINEQQGIPSPNPDNALPKTEPSAAQQRPGSPVPNVLPNKPFSSSRSNQKQHRVQNEEPPMNIAVTDLSEKEKKKAAGRLADMLIAAYVQLHQWGYNIATISNQNLQKLHIEGKINMVVLEFELTDGEGNTMTLKNLLLQYNKQLGEILVVSEDFKKEIRPLLIEELNKRGAGLTSGQTLLFSVIMDSVPKIAAVIQMRREMMGMMVEYSKNQ